MRLRRRKRIAIAAWLGIAALVIQAFVPSRARPPQRLITTLFLVFLPGPLRAPLVVIPSVMMRSTFILLSFFGPAPLAAPVSFLPRAEPTAPGFAGVLFSPATLLTD